MSAGRAASSRALRDELSDRGRSREAGLTLVELTIVIGLLGLCMVVIAGGLFTSINSSDVARRRALVQAELARYAEAVRSVKYQPCASPTYYRTAVASIYQPHSGDTAGAGDTVTFWQTSDGTNNMPTQFGSAAGAGCPASDQGVQQVTLNVSVTGGISASTTIVKRSS